jgi:hypothetical protein
MSCSGGQVASGWFVIFGLRRGGAKIPEIRFATLKDVNIPGTNNRVAGGLLDPDIHLTYFITADPEMQRWLGFTNYFFSVRPWL